MTYGFAELDILALIPKDSEEIEPHDLYRNDVLADVRRAMGEEER